MGEVGCCEGAEGFGRVALAGVGWEVLVNLWRDGRVDGWKDFVACCERAHEKVSKARQ